MFEVNGSKRRPCPALSMIAFNGIPLDLISECEKTGALEHDLINLQNIELIQLAAKCYPLCHIGATIGITPINVMVK
jgi:hypothetical protein